ncbi:response regulator transcription factor [Faecalicatena contorta]|uniref:Stage 0 sporulation protein A homolog n=1 Tax=Faecalicatena contorta TaxID=39482 RepID=A0A316A0G8_9FIRM|nr:response regulator [Faecalicatena contorta]PWJ50718.1 AraC family two component transcriptional regulator [Faecalicatena contorta]SUQ13286.1 Helix-turn-helix domain-containing protein [Faecalicatena contorta]
MRILIAEDEKRARKGLSSLIASLSEDYEIIAETANGRDALEMIKTLKPNLAFMDVKMPFMNGIEAIEAATAAGCETKFVILTAYEEFDIARRAIGCGVLGYLVKPIVREEIVEIMKKVTPQSQKKISNESLSAKYPEIHPLIRRALKEIETNYAMVINQGDLAKELGVSQEYFSNLFSKDIGIPFSKFLKEYRIEMAKALLLYGATDTREIPYAVGFSDEKYFNRVFKQVVGVSVRTFVNENKIFLK